VRNWSFPIRVSALSAVYPAVAHVAHIRSIDSIYHPILISKSSSCD
jgi:hypothetical protein